MFANLFFFIGLLIFIVQLIRFQNYRENDEFARQKLAYKDYPSERKPYLVFQGLVIFPYLVLGLITNQWWLFLAWWIISPVLTLLTKHWYFGRKLHTALGMTFGLFIILNHFHLHLTPKSVGLPF